MWRALSQQVLRCSRRLYATAAGGSSVSPILVRIAERDVPLTGLNEQIAPERILQSDVFRSWCRSVSPKFQVQAMCTDACLRAAG